MRICAWLVDCCRLGVELFSLEDARFFYKQLDPIIRGPEQGHDLQRIRRYSRAYLHCWKCIPHFVREVLGLSGAKNTRVWTNGASDGGNGWNRPITRCSSAYASRATGTLMRE